MVTELTLLTQSSEFLQGSNLNCIERNRTYIIDLIVNSVLQILVFNCYVDIRKLKLTPLNSVSSNESQFKLHFTSRLKCKASNVLRLKYLLYWPMEWKGGRFKIGQSRTTV